MPDAPDTVALLTATLVHTLFPMTSTAVLNQRLPTLLAAMQEFLVTTRVRQVMFLAQAGYESSGFGVVEENLTYTTATRLREVFSVFRTVDPRPYLHNPEALGSYIYAGKLGNGPVSSGDGYRYRGRGYLQVTGKANYAWLMPSLGHDIVRDPDYLCTPVGAARSACGWWYRHGLNSLADQRDLHACTRVLVGPSYLGEAQRRALWEQAQQLLHVPPGIGETEGHAAWC